MSKIISFILCLCVTVPVVSMELELDQIKNEKKLKNRKKREIAPLIVTFEEDKLFASELASRLHFCTTVTVSKYVPQDNPIYKIIDRLSKNFKECNNSVSELILAQSLTQRINSYKRRCDSNSIVKDCLQQIDQKEGDVELARKVVAIARQLRAEKALKLLQPSYSRQYLGATHIQDKIDHMKRNKDYPMNEEAVKDFIAFLMYQNIFAYQNIKK